MIRPRTAAFAAACAVLLLSVPLRAVEMLSLAQALRLAEVGSPALLAKDSERTALLDDAAVARTRPDPTLTLGFVNLPVTTADRFKFNVDDQTMKFVGLAQELTGGRKRDARGEALRERAAVTVAEQGELRSQLRAAVGAAWFDAAFATRAGALLHDLDAAARLDRVAAVAAYRGGQKPRGDIADADLQIAAIEDRLLVNSRELAVARARLGRWLGSDLPPAIGPMLDLARLPGATSAAHPAVAVAEARERAAQADIRVAGAERHVDPTIEAGFGQRDSGRSQMLSFTVKVPLQFNRRGRQDMTVAARTATAAQFAAERDDSARAAAAEIDAATAAWRIDRERLHHHAEIMEPAADAKVNAAVARYRGGGGTLADVIAARRTRFDVALETLAIEAEVARSWTALAALVPADQGIAP